MKGWRLSQERRKSTDRFNSKKMDESLVEMPAIADSDDEKDTKAEPMRPRGNALVRAGSALLNAFKVQPQESKMSQKGLNKKPNALNKGYEDTDYNARIEGKISSDSEVDSAELTKMLDKRMDKIAKNTADDSSEDIADKNKDMLLAERDRKDTLQQLLKDLLETRDEGGNISQLLQQKRGGELDSTSLSRSK